ncbi:GNAT family N-acetyltransferase [Herbaspirillum sp. SJZ099]|uniref:GNAT family N-acetyltransferase n=1 Tax=unclassified Herbaspirillum TaxID=2624150 RepID=UPI001154596B|nr:GNAT family N-acetyltransferase [Herbaspirillum sp. SJZ099]MBB5393350.1 GNAT superfamily N-acetyltransferase [Herbaspirillum sp. SJZ102]
MIEIQPFSSEHSAGVVDVILPIQQQEFGIPITLEGQPDLNDISGFYQKGNGNFWVALDGEKVVGTVSLLDIGNGQVALRKMFVAASHRGKEHGAAKRLLDGAIGWAREKGVTQIYLGTTAKFLAAHRFYEKNGFALVEKTALPPAFPVMAVDTRFYVLDCG